MFNRAKSRVRSRVEHVFGVVKRLWGFDKVRYRGLAKNATRSFVALGLAKIHLARGLLDSKIYHMISLARSFQPPAAPSADVSTAAPQKYPDVAFLDNSGGGGSPLAPLEAIYFMQPFMQRGSWLRH